MKTKENNSRDHTPYAIIVKPRKDLKIKYPCEVRMEDGAIIVIDRERVEKVAEER